MGIALASTSNLQYNVQRGVLHNANGMLRVRNILKLVKSAYAGPWGGGGSEDSCTFGVTVAKLLLVCSFTEVPSFV